MYKSFLSYSQLKEYLSVLLENGLLEYSEGQSIFKTTSKGLKYLGLYGQLDTLSTGVNPANTISSTVSE